MGDVVKSIFGGGGNSVTYNVPQPASPTPIDYDKMYAAATRSAIQQMQEQERSLERLYPKMTAMQLGTARQVAGELDNEYLARTRGVFDQELKTAASPTTFEDAIQRQAAAEMAAGPTALDRQILASGQGAMGVQADRVSGPSNIREIGAPLMSSVNAANVRDVRSRDVGAGQLGAALMQQAVERAQSGGRLSAEAERDAVQSARQGMAARGMATGNAGLAAELLNRDRFARARQAEDNAFASAVQGQDLTRQFSNQEARMRAALANQGVSAQQALANQAAAMDSQRLNQATLMQAQTQNQQRDQTLGEMAMRAQMANQQANQQQLAQNRGFMLSANDAFNAANDRRTNLALGANQLDLARRGRRITLAEGYGALDPFARGLNPAFGLGQATMGQGTQLIGNTFNNAVNQAGNVESFNRNMQAGMFNSWQNNNAAVQGANMQAGAMRQAGMMNMIGNIGSSILSDKREKKDIKPLGSAGKVLGLTAYEFKYKEQGTGSGEPGAKHVGFLAQDVKKVLPEAVEEVNYRGKKRLAIKPAVIGAALAQELTQAKAA
jgi:hypothetical protein